MCRSGGRLRLTNGRPAHDAIPLDKNRAVNHSGAMGTEIFKASRWTSGNHLFPTVIEVTDKAVVRRKRSWFSLDEISLSLTKVASVHVKTGLLWSDILIESSGGSDPLPSHGHTKADARRIRELIEDAQAAWGSPEKVKIS